MAFCSHLTRIAFPFCADGVYFIIAGEASRVSLTDGLRDLGDLPRLTFDEVSNSLPGQERFAATCGLCQYIELIGQLVRQAHRHHAHNIPSNSCITMFSL